MLKIEHPSNTTGVAATSALPGERRFAIAIHGGAGVIAKWLDPTPYYSALTRVIREAQTYASRAEVSAVDLAEYTVKLLEDEPLFNAGKGSVFAADGTHEMEASIMNGTTLRCGAISLLRTIQNPISAARFVMDRTDHVYMAGATAEAFIAEKGALQTFPNSYFDTEKRKLQLEEAKRVKGVFLDHDLETRGPAGTLPQPPLRTGVLVQAATPRSEVERTPRTDAETPSTGSHFYPHLADVIERDEITGPNGEKDTEGAKGTVGCVVMVNGQLAAATSTGGLTNKLNGRIGDSPIIGAGCYAHNDTCAVSATGNGEEFLRHVVGHDIASRMKYGKLSLKEAVHGTIHEMLTPEAGGVICVDAAGNIVLDYNSGGMFRGTCDSSGNAAVGIWEDLQAI